jgi:hypothetical protein
MSVNVFFEHYLSIVGGGLPENARSATQPLRALPHEFTQFRRKNENVDMSSGIERPIDADSYINTISARQCNFWADDNISRG